ncbi:MAG: adenosylcobinamide-GDP ribazoletransferase [Candidatus Methanosuratincola sp.]|jgi:adenosylcobinamide-GDP ribazoletransferase
MGLIGGLRSVLSFLTVLPFGSGTIDEMAQYAFFFPAAGALIGAISGGAGLVLFKFLDNSLAGWLTLLVLLLLTGFNHIDGVLDLGDALMFRGSSERRLEILHDRHHGIGGYAALFFVLVLTGSVISLLGPSILLYLLVAETLGKSSMLIAGGMGRPCPKGIGGVFVSKLKERLLTNIALGVAIALVVTLASFGPLYAGFLLSAAIVFPALFALYLQHVFGCITGDMLGCTSELTRLLVLLIFYLLQGALS